MRRHTLPLFASLVVLSNLNAQELLKPFRTPPEPIGILRDAIPKNESKRTTEVVIQLPQREMLIPFDPSAVMVSRAAGEWVLTHNGFTFKTFGEYGDDAQATMNAIRELAPQQWGTIGTGAYLVEYGLSRDAEQRIAGATSNVRVFTPIDRNSLRVELVRGSAVVRDDANLLLNFGANSLDAQQALAVIRKYNFNAVGTVGRHRTMTYLFTTTARLAPTTDAQKAMMLASQEQGLKRTGFIVPGVGIVGEQLTIDARKLEIKRLNGDVTLVHGTDVIAKFGVDEWTARDAQRIFREAKITEVCPFGTQGLSLYLSHGRPLKSLPIYTRSAKFDPASLRVMELGARWCVIDGIGRVSLPAGSQDEADRLLKLIRALNFDQICTVGHGTRHAITILAQER